MKWFKKLYWCVLLVPAAAIAVVWSPFAAIFGLMFWGVSSYLTSMNERTWAESDSEDGCDTQAGDELLSTIIASFFLLAAMWGFFPFMKCWNGILEA